MFPPRQFPKKIINRKPALIAPKVGQLEGELLKKLAGGNAGGQRVAAHRRQEILEDHAPPAWAAQPVKLRQIARRASEEKMRQAAGHEDADSPKFRPIEGRGLFERSASDESRIRATWWARKIQQRGVSRLQSTL